MPTKRKRRTRQRQGPVSLNSISLEQLLSFMAGWHPPKNEFDLRYGGWLTWAQFMADWLAIRDEFLAREDLNREPAFAEQVYKIYGAKGPPSGSTYDDIKRAIAAAEDKAVEEMLADVEVD